MRKVALLGKGASWVEAPFDSPEIEIWGLSDLYKCFEENPKENRFDRWFQMHEPKNFEGDLNFLRDLLIPIYMQQKYENIPKSVKYPKQEVEAFFGRRIWRSTPAYMIALAIFEGFEEIYLYGCNMAFSDNEHSQQKPSIEYFIGRAEERGIKIIIPNSSDILKSPFDYGYQKCPIGAEVFQQKIEEISAEKMRLLREKLKHEQKIGLINAQLYKLDGIIEISEYYKKLIY